MTETERTIIASRSWKEAEALLQRLVDAHDALKIRNAALFKALRGLMNSPFGIPFIDEEKKDRVVLAMHEAKEVLVEEEKRREENQ